MPDTTIAANVRKVAESWPGITKVVGQVTPRNIRNSDKPSEHSFGNALDIYGSRNAMSSLAAHLNANKGQLGVRIVCYDGGPGPNYDKCTTKHIDHIHVDMVPNCGGIVSVAGKSNRQIRDECEKYQQGRGVNPGSNNGPNPGSNDAEQGGGLLDSLNPFSGVAESVDAFRQDVIGWVRTGFFVAIGVGLAGAGLYMALKDTDAFQMVKGATTKALTKGAI